MEPEGMQIIDDVADINPVVFDTIASLYKSGGPKTEIFPTKVYKPKRLEVVEGLRYWTHGLEKKKVPFFVPTPTCCGAYILVNFFKPPTEEIAEDLKYSLQLKNFLFGGFIYAFLNYSEKLKWDKVLINSGFEIVGRVRNNNSGNTIYQYLFTQKEYK